jgi:nucleoside 2-deoxyribosyltransferase
MLKKTKIFLAGPFFSEAEKRFNSEIIRRLRREGYDVWAPQEAPFLTQGLTKEKKTIFQIDTTHLSEADIIVAVLDGKDVDSGTAFEIGLGHAQRKKIIGIKTDYRAFSKLEEINLMIESSLHALCDSIDQLVQKLKDLQ